MNRHRLAAGLGLAALAFLPGASPPADPGTMARALWLVQLRGTDSAAAPSRDEKTKGALFKALGKDGTIDAAEAGAFMDSAAFAKFAGPDGRLDPDELRAAVEADVPESRRALLPAIRAHADLLSTSFDRIDAPHLEAGASLAGWIASNHRPGKPLDVTVICTGNSRRSILGATMGNIAAAYHGLPEVRFHSGGTAPTAFNPRTAAALREIGVAVEPTGAEAPRGEPKTANPIYRVRWGSGLESTEFSKRYADPSNPQSSFAALLVCGEADAGCPVVRGASVRIAMPYLDPKIFDDSPYESIKYAERRDDLGRLMLATMLQARRVIASGTSSATAR